MAGSLRLLKRYEGTSVVWVYELTCSRCPVVFKARPHRSFTDSDREDEVMMAARRAGWETLKGERKSLCPACAAKAAADREAAKRERSSKIVVKTRPKSELDEPLAWPEAPSSATAEPPRQMSFSERRIILAKLEEVYLSESEGYGSGWSDRKLAADLGVPWAWVAELREANFGPARDNEDWRALKAESDEAAARASALLDTAHDVKRITLEALRPLEESAADIRNRLGQIERRMAELAKVWA